MSLISLIVMFAVVGLVLYLVETLPAPGYWKVVTRVFVILVILIFVLQFFGFDRGGPVLRWR